MSIDESFARVFAQLESCGIHTMTELEEAIRRIKATTESKAEGFGHVCLCLHHQADHANYANGCNNCSCSKFMRYRPAEPPQPSVQPTFNAKGELVGAEINEVISRNELKLLYPEAQPSVQGEQDLAQAHWSAQAAKEVRQRCCGWATDMEPVIGEIIRKHVPAPSITSARIEEIAKEQFDCVKRVACVADIETAMRKALREAGVSIREKS